MQSQQEVPELVEIHLIIIISSVMMIIIIIKKIMPKNIKIQIITGARAGRHYI